MRKHVRISDTVDFLHTYLKQPKLTTEDRIVHAVHLLTCAIQDVKSNNTSSQLAAIKKFQKHLQHMASDTATERYSSQAVHHATIAEKNTRDTTQQPTIKHTTTSRTTSTGGYLQGCPTGHYHQGCSTGNHQQGYVTNP